MSVTTFLSNETLWQEISSRIRAAGHVEAAIAYFGQGGAKLLPLSAGDRLVVDMSLSTVRAGGTDPREIEKLIRRGVRVFSRPNLHAKFVVADNWVISGSANVSKRSQQVLDEAAIMTNERSVIRRAREFINRLCTEPVRPKYLSECKQHYKAPRATSARASGGRRQTRVRHAKTWIVSLRDAWVPEAEVERYEQGEARAEERLSDRSRSAAKSFFYGHKPKMAEELEFGDWIIQVIRQDDGPIAVYPPGQLLLIDQYVRNSRLGKGRWVFHLELPKRGQTMTWRMFRRKAKPLLGERGMASPRTKPIRDLDAADGLLKLWTPGGRVARK